MTARSLTGLILAIACLGTAACSSWKRGSPALPTHSVEMDQLIIYSDSPPPNKHDRLLEEIAAQRMTLYTLLGLPASNEPIHVYLFRDVNRFKAFMKVHYPDFPDRRAFFVETDIKLSVYAYWGDRVAEDLRHEVAHGYLHAVVPRLPLWLDEGLAEYFEVPAGERGLNRPHVKLLSSAPKGEWRPDMHRLEGLRSAGEMTQADYAESWAWVHMLMETTPERRQFLQRHLELLRKDQALDPLSVQLKRAEADCENKLVAHVAELNKAVR